MKCANDHCSLETNHGYFCPRCDATVMIANVAICRFPPEAIADLANYIESGPVAGLMESA
jgi:hypothetical protein